ncbi:receptor-like protein kinase ANXUR2 [Prosopis cineraria]|uniref:receptor-like protein kinase ANXUR2 n=1 Tax=Prosopis cineraria TaxID=364024 RepID=UPI002410231D|nr:receptor-like protein kinase ANXUR2 [Prosopis cineraria]XP_054797145.1 receptor-like protein kinase ANXUR2 [Prosopis cineraria]
MCQLHHPNLVSFLGFCDDEFKDEMMVVYEYMPNGSLHHQLRERDSNSPALLWKTRLEISIRIARALHYLHVGTKGTIVHCDVKSQNILLDEHWNPKLSDFGLSLKGPKYSSKDKAKEVKRVRGTVGFMAPEYIINNKVSSKCDVFSFGMFLLELISRETLSQILMITDEEYDQEKKNEGKDKHASPSFKNTAEEVRTATESTDNWNGVVSLISHAMAEGVLRNLEEKGNIGKIIDPSLVGEIAPECWRLYIDIAASCLSGDPDARPDMGQVEVQLERALQPQQEADAPRFLDLTFFLLHFLCFFF